MRRAIAASQLIEEQLKDRLSRAGAGVGYEQAGIAEAAEWQQKAIELVPEARKEDYRSRLKLCREVKPYRNEPQK